MEKTEYIGCRLDPDTAKRFKQKAQDEEKRPPSQMLRILVEEFVSKKPAVSGGREAK